MPRDKGTYDPTARKRRRGPFLGGLGDEDGAGREEATAAPIRDTRSRARSRAAPSAAAAVVHACARAEPAAETTEPARRDDLGHGQVARAAAPPPARPAPSPSFGYPKSLSYLSASTLISSAACTPTRADAGMVHRLRSSPPMRCSIHAVERISVSSKSGGSRVSHALRAADSGWARQIHFQRGYHQRGGITTLPEELADENLRVFWQTAENDGVGSNMPLKISPADSAAASLPAWSAGGLRAAAVAADAAAGPDKAGAYFPLFGRSAGPLSRRAKAARRLLQERLDRRRLLRKTPPRRQ